MTNNFETTNRSDFTWPFLAERQRIFDWDRYEFKAEAEHPHFLAPQSFSNVETLKTIPYTQRLPFDFDCYPKPIYSSQQPITHYPTEVCKTYNIIVIRETYLCQVIYSTGFADRRAVVGLFNILCTC